MERPSNPTAPVAIAAVTVLFVAILAAYVAGYFMLRKGSISTEGECYRLYSEPWQATVYQPAAYVESLVTGVQVETSSRWR